jgi:hypothetical protein
MLSLETEIEHYRDVLGGAAADLLVARARRDVFSLAPEIRIAAWGGAMLIATAAGLFVKNNYDRIGPLALSLAIGVFAIACYAWVWRRRARAGLVDDYVLLLGALLVSADVGLIESQWHFLDAQWPRHFLLLAVAHGLAAYLYDSKALLSLSITALAAWLGLERRSADVIFSSEAARTAPRAFLCATIVIAWRLVHWRWKSTRRFERVFEHFASLLALLGGIALMMAGGTTGVGVLITIIVAAVVMYWGFHVKSEPFVLYGFLAAAIAVDVFLLETLNPPDQLTFLIIAASMIAAIAALIGIHARFRRVAG